MPGSKAHVPKLLLNHAMTFQSNNSQQKDKTQQRNGVSHANSLQVQPTSNMLASQDNPKVKVNNFESNRAQAEAQRQVNSVDHQNAGDNFINMLDLPTPEKANEERAQTSDNPVAQKEEHDDKTTTADAGTVE